jgi:hypothetical protein
MLFGRGNEREPALSRPLLSMRQAHQQATITITMRSKQRQLPTLAGTPPVR